MKLLKLKSLFLNTRIALKKWVIMLVYQLNQLSKRCYVIAMKLPGVLSCSVPGAGGYDAISNCIR